MWAEEKGKQKLLSLRSTTVQFSQQVEKIIFYCHRWSCSSPLVSLGKHCTLTLSRLWSGHLDPHFILLILLPASGDSPMHRTWTLMLSVQVHRHGHNSNLKKVEDFEAEIALICVLKASRYIHMRESNVKSIRVSTWQSEQLGKYTRAERGRTWRKRQNNFLRTSTSNWMIVFSFTLRSLVVMECSPTSFETNTIAESSSL